MDDLLLTDGVIISWLVGVSISTICFITQILIYIFVPNSQKFDLKVLTQITIARLLNAGFEFLVATTPPGLEGWKLDLTLMLYLHSDSASICWMFVFSKNLYDKVTQVFITKKITFTLTAVLVWLLTLPVGILPVILLYINLDYFDIFYKVYAIIKFIILSVNLLFFGRIFFVAIRRKISGNSTGILRLCVITFILICISSAQVFLSDLVAFFEQNSLMFIFCVINSYQTVAVMTIFVMLVYGSRKRNNTPKPFNSVSNSAV